MKKLFYALAFLVTTGIQIYVTKHIYERLAGLEAFDEKLLEVVGTYVSQQEFIESTVVKHDEEISTLKAVCGGK